MASAEHPPLLLIEDTPSLQMMYRAALTGAGYQVVTAARATEGWLLFQESGATVVLLDLMLPDGDGLTLLRKMLEERPAKGLLGGTLAFPSAHWDGRDLPPPGVAAWREIGHVRHVFTHFTLSLQVLMGDLDAAPDRGHLVPLGQIDRETLPGLMRKVWDMAQADIAA